MLRAIRAAYDGYYQWQVFYATDGTYLLPEGYGTRRPGRAANRCYPGVMSDAMWWRRSDGRTRTRTCCHNRRAMPYLMRGRNEAAVYFEQDSRLAKTDRFIRAWNQANPMLRRSTCSTSLLGLREALERTRAATASSPAVGCTSATASGSPTR